MSLVLKCGINDSRTVYVYYINDFILISPFLCTEEDNIMYTFIDRMVFPLFLKLHRFFFIISVFYILNFLLLWQIQDVNMCKCVCACILYKNYEIRLDVPIFNINLN